MKDTLQYLFREILRYQATIDERSVFPDAQALKALRVFEEPFPEGGTAPPELLSMLCKYGSPATVATTGGRYFGFVTGGTLPATVLAAMLAAVWDENGSMEGMSPLNAKLEQVTSKWLLDALDLPAQSAIGYVTGATMANFSALAAARFALLHRQDWDVGARGLFGAPPLRVIVGEEVHVSLLKALSLLGLGRERVLRVPVDDQGRMKADALPELDDRSILCLQSGNVNTGAFDPATRICQLARAAGTWIHVDGAFGLWARASATKRQLAEGLENADSWATDTHKWLNVPYDSGLVICRDPEYLKAAMSATAAYLLSSDRYDPFDFTPEMSRRARVIEVWAALKYLGRQGLRELIDRHCRLARQFAEGLRDAGFQILNEVVLNQVLVSFGSAERTRAIIDALQRDGTCWCGGTIWQGKAAMRISVSDWKTTEEEVTRSLSAIIKIAHKLG